MAMFVGNRESSMRVKSPTSARGPASPTTTTLLADGYTDDGQLSRYDNARRASQFSLCSTLNARLSIASLGNFDEGAIIEEMLQRIGNQCDAVQPEPQIYREKPSDMLGKLKYYYDKYNLRYIAPFLLLLLYSILGAALFYWVESDNEQKLLREKAFRMEALRNETFHRLKTVMVDDIWSDQTKLFNLRDILVWYERQLATLKQPDMMEWDMWGALFYVGTIFTTIGYGNIAPRTAGGQALSIVYALIGIPLVLAILSQFGKTLTHLVSSIWIRYRQCVKGFARRRRIARKLRSKKLWGSVTHRKHTKELLDAEEGNTQLSERNLLEREADFEEREEDEHESRTIPVWLALLICIGWICACAGLFCIWETNWNYFTSLYFFFISLSTIGLGDVVPDHPHMLILMFWLVIVGLSIVSMLLSVIQIKMEEWLYHLMIRMQKEYQRALASGSPVERQKILEKLMAKEPWLMRNMARNLISENQAAQLDHQAETFERSVRTVNNKNIQTEYVNTQRANETQVDSALQQDMATDVRSFASRRISTAEKGTSLKELLDEPQEISLSVPTFAKDAMVGSTIPRDDDVDSVSDATSLPMDPTSFDVAERGVQVRLSVPEERSQSLCTPKMVNGCAVQTDIAQFEVDEIMLKLHDLQTNNRVKPLLMDRSMATSIEEAPKVDVSEQAALRTKQTQYDLLPIIVDMSVSTHDAGEYDQVERSTETSDLTALLNRSMETDAWMSVLQTPECSRAVQTHFDEPPFLLDDVDDINLLTSKRRRLSRQNEARDSLLIDCETQCALPSRESRESETQTHLDMIDFAAGSFIERNHSSSTISLHGSVDEDPVEVSKQDLIIQTDDSYLKIARRLDEIRSNRTASLPVCAAKPLTAKSDDPSQTSSRKPERLILYNEQPSERRGFTPDPNRGRRKSFKRGVDKMLSPKSPHKVKFDLDGAHMSASEVLRPTIGRDSLQVRTDVS